MKADIKSDFILKNKNKKWTVYTEFDTFYLYNTTR